MRKMLDEEKQMFRQIRLLSPLLNHIDLRQAFRIAVRAVEAAEREDCAKECDGMAGHYRALRDKGPKEFPKHIDVDTLRMFASEECAAVIRGRRRK